ncbi:MAG: hypothetical protein COA52_10515 [Hyphomicrobiales bacterium]|nr:MAG: hypothetical protein COA52_10515 [Hyphomicrobiales bacterium]
MVETSEMLDALPNLDGENFNVETMDVSADLGEFQRTPVLVVCAGVKAILDIPKTLEKLETLGIPVVAYNQDTFPAFWSSDSGLKAPLRMNTPQAIARLVQTRKTLGQNEGVIVANPVAPEDEILKQEMEPVIAQALSEAKQKSITGKAITPFLLQRIFELTNGKSLATNIALVESNARLASKIAVQLAKRS